jgi:hypothetical protein
MRRTVFFLTLALATASAFGQSQVNVNDPSLRPSVPLNQASHPLSQDKEGVTVDQARLQDADQRAQDDANGTSNQPWQTNQPLIPVAPGQPGRPLPPRMGFTQPGNPNIPATPISNPNPNNPNPNTPNNPTPMPQVGQPVQPTPPGIDPGVPGRPVPVMAPPPVPQTIPGNNPTPVQ